MRRAEDERGESEKGRPPASATLATASLELTPPRPLRLSVTDGGGESKRKIDFDAKKRKRAKTARSGEKRRETPRSAKVEKERTNEDNGEKRKTRRRFAGEASKRWRVGALNVEGKRLEPSARRGGGVKFFFGVFSPGVGAGFATAS